MIRGYVALLNPELVQKDLIIFLNLTLNQHGEGKRETFLNTVSALPEVVELYQTSGSCDFLAKVRVQGVQEFRNFLVEKVGKVANVKDIISHVVLEEIKHTTKIFI